MFQSLACLLPQTLPQSQAQAQSRGEGTGRERRKHAGILCDELVCDQFPAMTNRGGVPSQISVVLKVGTLEELP